MRYRWHGTAKSQTDRFPGSESRAGRTVQGGGRRSATATTASDPAGHHRPARLSRHRHRLWAVPRAPLLCGLINIWPAAWRSYCGGRPRRCRALRGQRVVIPQQQRYEWAYGYGALEVLGGAAQFRFMPSVNLAFSRDFLRQIAASDLAAEHVIIQDQAGFHPRLGDAGLPNRIHLLPLPPYSPELNPIEGLWDQVPEVTCNRRQGSLADLEKN
jgi:hypothetical protein